MLQRAQPAAQRPSQWAPVRLPCVCAARPAPAPFVWRLVACHVPTAAAWRLQLVAAERELRERCGNPGLLGSAARRS